MAVRTAAPEGGDLPGTNSADTLIGLEGDDLLRGLGGPDSLAGGAGADTLIGGTNNDLLIGGAGGDRFLIDVREFGRDTIQDFGAGDVLDLSFLGVADLATLQPFLSQVSTDVVFEAGWAGATERVTLRDTTLGALAANRFVFNTSLAALDSSGTNSTDALFGGLADDRLRGLGGADTLAGGAGADTLIGGTNNDLLIGGAGGDSMLGEAGNDTYWVDNPLDVVLEAFDAGIDEVRASVTFQLGANVERLTLLDGAVNGTGNGQANRITGNAQNNLLAGAAGDDTLIGGDGLDVLSGGAGRDSMVGGLGNDRYVVENAEDIVVELAGQGLDLVISSLSYTLGAELERLNFNGAADTEGTGNALVNRIAGNAGANLLRGLDGGDNLLGFAGNDTLVGGEGRDLLTGGPGQDTFLFERAGLPDRIADFTRGEDLLGISVAGFGGGLAEGLLPAARFVAHASPLATGAAGTGQFIYQTNQQALLWDPDGVGGVGASRVAVLTGVGTLSAADFILLA
ncbi:calcium-binding protein [Falsiroseomonas selenitidurans]|uniref:Calcium-binding protein n=1 Tax=Falsiroseomonas selenitidurans TaxID=2716335 RepID=A0ABX1E623_9PROT|nr:calcium-binding protein [Falsiroseomonas selenitidurans]NKC30982.1 calcium-binding protein [Falsiroseomonas selenitidurans]